MEWTAPLFLPSLPAPFSSSQKARFLNDSLFPPAKNGKRSWIQPTLKNKLCFPPKKCNCNVWKKISLFFFVSNQVLSQIARLFGNSRWCRPHIFALSWRSRPTKKTAPVLHFWPFKNQPTDFGIRGNDFRLLGAKNMISSSPSAFLLSWDRECLGLSLLSSFFSFFGAREGKNFSPALLLPFLKCLLRPQQPYLYCCTYSAKMERKFAEYYLTQKLTNVPYFRPIKAKKRTCSETSQFLETF